MKRRNFLLSVVGLPGATALANIRIAGSQTGSDRGRDLEDPYAGVEWDRCTYLHSMSHQHQGQTDASRDVFYAMGYRHFAFSNYYPSAPTYPLPGEYLRRRADVIGCPNAEHHSFPDTSLHFNAPGSLLATGYGSSLSGKRLAAAPLRHSFEGLHVFPAGGRPWLSVYRLDVTLAKAKGATEEKPAATLSLDGAVECAFREGFADRGAVRERSLSVGKHSLYLRTTASTLEALLQYDPTQATVTQFRLMQGANRPWRDVFRAALDGEMVDGQRQGGLLYPDGGGITLNHPTGDRDHYLPMLDFDPRVLGIEVWNQLTTGFGSSTGFYDRGTGPHLHYYRLWDDILRTGRRCWGFFVKDHLTYGRGRNVLLVPSPAGRTPEEQERDALRAYRNGAFFGSVAALAANDAGEVIPPYDRSDFRFRHITIKRDAAGVPTAVTAAVTGNDPAKRPQVQIRFVTDRGIEHVVDAAEAEFPLRRDASGRLIPVFVRVEAFAYPITHNDGEPLTPAKLRGMDVYAISLLHDRKATGGPVFFGGEQEYPAPIPIVDMLFSQPLRRV